jgi:hypothetical protein
MKNTKLILARIFILLNFFLIIQCAASANSDTGNEKTFIISSQTVDCTGVAPMKCLQVKEKATDNWSNFYSNIEGFTYEPGFEYILKVKTEKIENPPADGSSIKYILVRQISKTKK